ncbi:NUDIX domain-containing protein [Erythrobacter sp. SDW2]|uniref:NUDIX hydrolase n=1 Tax=Erythrobacter sp. SDW2 TaxID=2907154 RepID=UPI001F3AE34F|nr:NUDIX domain-containing protein [Erythrobacter sp. SDW2]UIP06326.1 NUDIX domain-containing protein [Erythrobacter sp. SDW2]
MSEAAVAKRIRRAARLIVLDPLGRVLLFRYDVPGRPPFWVTVGGECDPGESFEDAARRELREETGFEAEPGPQICRMTPEFVTVEGEPVQADERFFRVHVRHTDVDISGHTELEQRLMKEHRWFTRAELSGWHEYIYPRDLAELIEKDPQP